MMVKVISHIQARRYFGETAFPLKAQPAALHRVRMSLMGRSVCLHLHPPLTILALAALAVPAVLVVVLAVPAALVVPEVLVLLVVPPVLVALVGTLAAVEVTYVQLVTDMVQILQKMAPSSI